MRVPSPRPLFEEPFKLIPIFFVLYFQCASGSFLLAIASGLGFPDCGGLPISVRHARGFSYAVSGILGRIDSRITLGLHSPLHGGSLLTWSFKRQRNKELSWQVGSIFFVSGFGLHFVGNSPIGQIETELPLAIPFLTAVGLFLIYQKAYLTQPKSGPRKLE